MSRNNPLLSRLFFGAFLLLASATAGAADFYFDSDGGDDTNGDGTQGNPWATIAKANTLNLGPGDQVLFQGGDTFGGNLTLDVTDSGASGNPITITSYGAGKATLSAGNGSGITLNSVSFAEIKSIDIVGSGSTTNTGRGVYAYNNTTSSTVEHLVLDDIDIQGFGKDGIAIFAWGNTSGTDEFYNDISVTNVRAHHNADPGMQTWADDHYGLSDVYVAHCRFDHQTQIATGIVLGFVDGAIIEYCEAHDNVGEGGVGIWAYDSRDVIIQHNLAYNNDALSSPDGGGYDLDTDVSDSIVQYNYSYNNTGAGVLISHGGVNDENINNTVRYNVSVNDGRQKGYAGIELYGNVNYCDIYNNLIIMDAAPAGTPRGIRIGTWSGIGNRSADSVRFMNNLILTKASCPVVYVQPAALANMTNISFTGNLYYNTTDNVKFEWGNNTYNTLAGWRSATSQEMLSGQPTGIVSNPMLADIINLPAPTTVEELPNLTELFLLSGSPAINAGLDLNAEFGIDMGTQDFIGAGIPVDGAYDIGAVEYNPVDYYFSNAGDDATGDGSESNPWATIAKANTLDLDPGDRILFEGGDIFTETDGLMLDINDSGWAGNPVRISSYGTGRATLEIGDNDGIYANSVSYLEISDVNIVGSGYASSSKTGILSENATENSTVVHLRISNVSVSEFKSGIQIFAYGNDTSYYEDILIENSEAHDNRNSGIESWADAKGHISNITVRNCKAYNNYGGTSNNSGNGIVLGRVDDALIEYCVAYNNGHQNNSGTPDGPVAIWCYDANDMTIQHCEAYNNGSGDSQDGGGFDLGGNVTNSVMQYNYSHDNEGYGYLIDNSAANSPNPEPSNNVVRYNISENDCREHSYGGILINTPLSGLDVYGNTIYMTPRGSGSTAGIRIGFNGLAPKDYRIRNNIIIIDQAGLSGQVYALHVPKVGTDIFIQNNLYYKIGGGDVTFSWDSVTYNSLTAFRNATNQEMLDGTPVGYQADPQLLDAGNAGTIGDAYQIANITAYDPLPGSPVIGAGLDLLAEFGIDMGTQDFAGNSIPLGAYDIGAIESLGRAMLPLTDDFEDRVGLLSTVPGPWTLLNNVALEIKESIGAGTSRGLEFGGVGGEAAVYIDQNPVSVLWHDFDARLSVWPVDSTPTNSNSDAAVAFLLDENGDIRALDGTTWTTYPAGVDTALFHRYTLEMDYTAQTYNLYMDGNTTAVAGGVSFAHSVAAPNYVNVRQDSDQAMILDNVYISTTAPTGFGGSPTDTYADWSASQPWPGGSDMTPGGDSEGDGVVNLLEYALDLDVSANDYNHLPEASYLDDSMNQWAIFTYRRNTSQTDLTYTVQESADRSTWSDLIYDGVNVVETIIDGDVDGDGSAELVEVKVKLSSPDETLFLRLTVNDGSTTVMTPALNSNGFDIPSTEDFEAYAIDAPLDGVGGWFLHAGIDPEVKEALDPYYSQVAEIIGDTTDLSAYYRSNAAATTWVDMNIVPSVYGATAPTVDGDTSLALYFDADGYLNVTDGGTWLTLNTVNAVDTDTWQRLTTKLDYTNHLADVWLNGLSVATDLFFIDNRSQFSGVRLRQESTEAAYLDNVRVQDTAIEAVFPYSEDFEAASVSPLWTATSGSIAASTEQAQEGSQSLKINGTARAEFGGMGLGETWVDLRVYADGSDTLPSLNADTLIGIHFDTTGKVFVTDGPTWADTGATVTLNSWQRITVKMDYVNDTCDVHVNTSAAGTGYDFSVTPDTDSMQAIDVTADNQFIDKVVVSPSSTL